MCPIPRSGCATRRSCGRLRDSLSSCGHLVQSGHAAAGRPQQDRADRTGIDFEPQPLVEAEAELMRDRPAEAVAMGDAEDGGPRVRSEESTSELQSLLRIAYDVICLKQKG